jgi:hypothetical protein
MDPVYRPLSAALADGTVPMRARSCLVLQMAHVVLHMGMSHVVHRNLTVRT